ncbi:MAG: glycosyltransferase 87 family protein [Planctomycetota bacterium]|nr:glycosyltransferase 87 family protein [Planctomycetota bacterium]
MVDDETGISHLEQPVIGISNHALGSAAEPAAAAGEILALRPKAVAPWWQRYDQLIGWTLWGLLIVVAAGLELAGNQKSVTRAYAVGGHGWLHGEDMYNGAGSGFIYLPISGLLFVPMAATPGPAVEIAWRVFTIGAFALALWFSGRLIERRVGSPCFLAMSGMGVILAFPAARNGQATLPMLAFLVAAIAATVARRHGIAAAAATAAILMKPLALPVVAVLALLRPRLIPPLAAGCLLLVGLPFLITDTDWAHRQNAGFLEVLRISQQMQGQEAWATLFGIFNVSGHPVPAPVRLAVQLAASLAVVLGCREALRRLDPGSATLHVFTLTITLLLLLSPRTENNTYACIVPALVMVMAAAATARPPRRVVVAGGWLAAIAIIGSYELGRRLAPGVRGVWLAPLTTTLLTPWFVVSLLDELRSSGEATARVVRLPVPGDAADQVARAA